MTPNVSAPAPRNSIGMEIGALSSNWGRRAAASVARPAPVYREWSGVRNEPSA
jgi:hypothetical protein